MPATYTYDHDALSTNIAKVQLYSRQTGTTSATRDFSDQEIAAILAEQTIRGDRAKVYMAASELILMKVDEYSSVGKGIDSRKLSKLSITYGGRNTKLESLVQLADRLEKKARKFSRTKNRTARLVNASGMRGVNNG